MFKLHHLCLAALLIFGASLHAEAQHSSDDAQFGPVVRSYLGYLRNEQNVVDDRASRHEVNQSYYRRNSNRIRALRQMAVRIADENGNDYLPELEAVAGDEFGLLFENPPKLQSLRAGSMVGTTFRYLGSVRSNEMFYVFARLDPYEQAELMQLSKQEEAAGSAGQVGRELTRARRVSSPK